MKNLLKRKAMEHLLKWIGDMLISLGMSIAGYKVTKVTDNRKVKTESPASPTSKYDSYNGEDF